MELQPPLMVRLILGTICIVSPSSSRFSESAMGVGKSESQEIDEAAVALFKEVYSLA
jgi:hypothetical protein